MRNLWARDVALEFPAPPRRVRRKPWTGGNALWFVRLFILPHTLIGLYLLLSIPAHIYVATFGTHVSAIVDSRDTGKTSKGHAYWQISYHFLLDGKRYDRQDSVGEGEYNMLHVGDQFAGRASRMIRDVVFIGPRWVGASWLGLAGAALFWNGVLSVFVYNIWFVPLRLRWIVRVGYPAIAIVTGRRAKTGKGATYTVFYSFTTPDGQSIDSKCEVNNLDYERAVEGSTATVLYDPRKPTRSLLYEYCEYEVVG